MTSFISRADRKQISNILNLIRFDCIELYGKFHKQKIKLNHAIELYEEFMCEEINCIFQISNGFSEIVLTHRKRFIKFMDETNKLINNGTVEQNGFVENENKYVLHISLQQWLLQGPKGQYFYFIIDIDSFDLTKQLQRLNTSRENGTNKVFNKNPSEENHHKYEKIAKISAADFVHRTFIVFIGTNPIDCDVSDKKDIESVQYFLKGDHEIGIIPVKCVFLLLQRLFYGVSNSETNDKTTFSSKIIVNHKYEFSVKTLLSQIEAKNAASRKAVNQLCEVENKYNQHKQIDIFPDGFASSIQNLILNEFKMNCPRDVDLDRLSTVLAGIIQTNGTDIKTAKVIILATGTKNIDAISLLNEAKNVVADTHAEVVARRCLVYYFYDQIDSFLTSDYSNSSIFEKSHIDSRLKLKDNIRFHLYVSRGPCGDATEFGSARNNKNHIDRGKLRAKIEKAEGYKKVEELIVEQSGSSFQDNKPMYTMTCSDKIARWNVVGVQGALLSRIIEPIYLSSIIIGRPRHINLIREHISFSFHGRIEKSLGYLPRMYYHNKPHLDFTESNRRNTHHEAPPFSINWITGSNTVEKIESKTGQLCNGDSKISRISKKILFRRFLHIKNNFQHLDSNDSGTLYANEKLLAKDFQDAKKHCIAAFRSLRLGNWEYAMKPPEIDRFNLDSNEHS